MTAPQTKPAIARDTGEFLVPEAFKGAIGYFLRIAQEASFQAFAAAADRAELRPGWYAILTVLRQYGELTPSDLSSICGRDRSTLTATLKGLGAEGLVERRPNANDQRSYGVRLTYKGRETQARLQAMALRHDRRLDEIVGKDKEALIAILARIAGALTAGGTAGPAG
jgi:DNA-binding MarR family transcriptional regulator